jgi:hypothetical protein
MEMFESAGVWSLWEHWLTAERMRKKEENGVKNGYKMTAKI